MQINGKIISEKIFDHLKSEIKKNHLKPKLVVFGVNPKDQDLSFIKAKEKACTKIGAEFELVLFKKALRFEEFAKKIKSISQKEDVTAIIIQKPLPSSLNSVTLFNYIHDTKEIEGHKKKSPFVAPIGLAVLSVIKSAYAPKKNLDKYLVNFNKDIAFFKNIFKKKRVVIVGRGETGGMPIGDTFSRMKINYISINSKTPDPNQFLKKADFIISAVGQKVIMSADIKSGAFLISIGIRKDNDQWQGDYDEMDIKNIASIYTPTPGGIGPVDIAYLMYNLVSAAKLQKQEDY